MPVFKLHCVSAIDGEEKVFYYNNETSDLLDENGENVLKHEQKSYSDVVAIAKDKPGIKASPKLIKIQMGLSCNYSCFYCNQRFVPHAESTSNKDVDAFIETLPTWFLSDDGEGCTFEFWGGEPFVYWKTMKPLAEALKELYPQARMNVITNGSLIDDEKIEWLDAMNFHVAISHDGPGQNVRGPDPLLDMESRKAILALYHRLKPSGRVSINAMVNVQNQSREAIYVYLQSIFGEDIPIGEGGFIDPYDEGGLASCLDESDFLQYRNRYLVELRDGKIRNFVTVMQKAEGFFESLKTKRPASSVGQKCGMDSADAIAVDLRGNVLTCQNVSSVATSMNGELHKIGHVSDLEKVELNTATHWKYRNECSDCPVLQLCKGSCMFLENEYWEKGCDMSFSDNIPLFAAVIETATGYLPTYIEGPQRDSRKDVFGVATKYVGSSHQ